MADDIVQSLTTSTTSFLNANVIWFLVGIVFLIIVGVLLYYKYLASFKHTLVLFKQTEAGTKDIAIMDKYKYFKDERGINKIKLKSLYAKFLPGFGTLTLNMPPSASKSVMAGGSEFSVGTLISMDEVVWANTKMTLEDIKAKNIKFEPLSTMERSLLVSEYERSEQRKKKNIIDLLSQYGGTILLIVFFVLLMVFWEKFWQPVNAAISAADTIIKDENTLILNQIELQRVLTIQEQILFNTTFPSQAFLAQNLNPTPPNGGK